MVAFDARSLFSYSLLWLSHFVFEKNVFGFFLSFHFGPQHVLDLVVSNDFNDVMKDASPFIIIDWDDWEILIDSAMTSTRIGRTFNCFDWNLFHIRSTTVDRYGKPHIHSVHSQHVKRILSYETHTNTFAGRRQQPANDEEKHDAMLKFVCEIRTQNCLSLAATHVVLCRWGLQTAILSRLSLSLSLSVSLVFVCACWFVLDMFGWSRNI